MSITAKQYNAINDTATTTESEFEIKCKYVNYIINNSITDTLYVSFENSIDTDTNYIVVLPETTFKNFKVNSKKVYFKASANTIDFNFLCVDESPTSVRC